MLGKRKVVPQGLLANIIIFESYYLTQIPGNQRLLGQTHPELEEREEEVPCNTEYSTRREMGVAACPYSNLSNVCRSESCFILVRWGLWDLPCAGPYAFPLPGRLG
ncbi:uncharacterized protein LOC132685551 [Panthera onca]